MGNCNNKNTILLEEQIINLRKENYNLKNELEKEKKYNNDIQKLLITKKQKSKQNKNFYSDLINTTINQTNLKTDLNNLLNHEINHLTDSERDKVIYKTIYTSIIKMIDYVIRNKI